jgi:phosphatidylethanolamine-binding protein (PEBP) family uncharacterized protein
VILKHLIALGLCGFSASAFAEGPLSRPPQAAPFVAFAPQVRLRWDDRYLYVEDHGLPAHGMMVGITAWQQQVPLPQSYVGENAWRIPLKPVPARVPQLIRGHFLRGAIAVAANGIPIFNPQNNRGEISQEIGELDQWGGHCGRADDYHYHAAPLHLQSAVGKEKPIAYSLDGYAIYGLNEPDSSAPGQLDDCCGHATAALGYHYHSSTKYPYVNGGFHGEVVERDGQVDPQPRAQPVRPALPQLRGAKITDFKAAADEKSFRLQYSVNGKPGAVNYASISDGAWKFQFINADGTQSEETYRAGGSKAGQPARGDQATQAAIQKNSGSFVLRSPVVSDGGALPIEFTGDGSSATLPLEWSGAPAGTQSYALIMHHLDPEGKTKVYWTLYQIPATTHSLPKNASGIGVLGTNTINDRIGYAPPHSKGPGAKTYVISLYALSAAPPIHLPASQVTGVGLLASIKDLILASTDLNVVYTRGGATKAPESGERKPTQITPDHSGVVKPTMADTVKVNVYADNWFVLYINGKLTAVDPIGFLPHNVVSVDILLEYPMTIAVMAKDNADAKTGMEYGDHMGDGGFIIKFADGTVSNATWKAKCFFKGPLNQDTKNSIVEHTPIPGNWWATDFDDSQWPNAVEYTEQRVNPKEVFHSADFAPAKFIWTSDLNLDNTVIFRTKIEKPGWKSRWNTQPDLDVSGASPR